MKTSFPRFRGRRSSALVLTLIAVVLVTLAVLAFFISVSSNRQVENSRAHGALADQMVRTAGDYVEAKFLAEITGATYSASYPDASGTTIYAPANATNAVPLRNISSGITASDSTFFNLIRQSVPTADPNASGDSTSLPANNGRTVGLNKWNAPMLNPGSGFSSSTQLPNWIYVDRTNGPTTSLSTNIIGRFAYNVYNIGGLLNINAAGHSSTIEAQMTANPTYANYLKNTLAGAYLTNFPGVAQPDVDMLATNRNLGTATDTTAFTNVVTSEAQAGFLNPVVTNVISPGSLYTNSFFNGRQDFLRYARTQGTGSLTNAAPYLTTFSRSVNAPSWEPLADVGTYKYFSNANATTSTNRFIPNVRALTATSIPHYNDDGTLGTPTVVQPGDPLIQHRFSLTKLAWIGHTGPNTAAFNSSLSPAQIAVAIQACFGLVWDPNPTEVTPLAAGTIDPRWDYVGPTGSAGTGALSIETLSQIAAGPTPREPNFFELLQAGILSGSLGQSGENGGPATGDGYSGGTVVADEVNNDYQLIRIGANIIDQARADNFPTAIEFNGFEFWGIKDLPYFNKLILYGYWPDATPALIPDPPFYVYLTYELWNPHQPTGIQGPTKFRVRINSAAQYKILYHTAPTIPATTGSWTGAPDGSSFAGIPNSPLLFTANNIATDIQHNFRDPQVIRTGPQTPGATIGPTPGGADALVFEDTVDSPYGSYTNNYTFAETDTVFILEYSEDGINYKPYSTFEGHEENGGVIGFGGQSTLTSGIGMTSGFQAQPPASYSIDSLYFLVVYSKTDPRTFRFDSQGGGSMVPDQSFRPATSTYYSTYYDLPYFMNGGAGLMAKLASNNSGNAQHFYPDPDGNVRPGDSWFNDQNPFLLGDWGSGPSSQRPIILDRPLRSVAEMGYAYRDLPFKTLDFFSSASGDKGLLDLFSVVDEPAITAGSVDLNSSQPLVRQTLLAGNSDAINSTTLASDYQSYAFGSGSTPTANIPRTRAQLADFIFGNASLTSNPGTPGTPLTFTSSNLKTVREGAVRALGGPVQTRTWNLLIDVVAQTGRFVNATTTGNNFVVEGEKHCWLSVAIDRYTGKVVDQQLEFINE